MCIRDSILSGQTALFALAGLVLFLRLHERRQVFAGLALWLCALKPHLFLPFGAVVLLWIFASRSYRILAAAILALISSSLFASYLDPSVWTQYFQMARSSGIEHEFIPCLGVGLRFAIRPQAMWLEYVPAAAGCVWAIYFYWRRRDSWDWMEDGAVLMLVSILVAPYEWPTDQALLIPALLVGVYRATSWTQLGTLALASAMVAVSYTHLDVYKRQQNLSCPTTLAAHRSSSSSIGKGTLTGRNTSPNDALRSSHPCSTTWDAVVSTRWL